MVDLQGETSRLVRRHWARTYKGQRGVLVIKQVLADPLYANNEANRISIHILRLRSHGPEFAGDTRLMLEISDPPPERAVS